MVQLARKTIEEYLKTGKISPPDIELPPDLPSRAGVFVSLKRKGQLRGCIGTITPQERTLAEEVQKNALSSAFRDPRFPPLSPSELSDLEISVDVLTPPEVVKDRSELDPARYGVIVESGWRKGVLLPALEGVETIEEQLSIALQKAGISPREPYKIYRFEVQRFH